MLNVELGPKRLELLHELVPTATAFALLLNPTNPECRDRLQETAGGGPHPRAADFMSCNASTERDFDTAFATLSPTASRWTRDRPRPILHQPPRTARRIGGTPRGPAIYEYREFAAAGGLMSYGGEITEPIVKSASIPAAFSRATSRPTCPFSSPRKSS